MVRDEHLVLGRRGPGRRHVAARPLPRPALLQPGPGDGARRGHPCRDHLGRGVSGRARLRRERGQEAGPDPRLGRLHRQPAARALHARRHPRLRGGRRLDRGDRRGHEGGRRPPDGPAHARRLRRARHDGRDLRRAVRRVPRAALRAPPAAAQDALGGVVRPQVGHGVLRLRGRAAGAEPGHLMRAALLELLRPPPHRGPLIAAGAVLVTLGVALEEVRLDDTLSTGVHLAILGLASAAVYAPGVQVRQEGRPYAFQSVLLVCGLALLAPALLTLADVLGADFDSFPAGAITWTSLVLAGVALWA